MNQNYKELEEKIGIIFNDKELLKTAFIHRSYINEHKKDEIESNERLEFLGDAVLELIATKHLYETCPDKNEGDMTAYRSALVKGKHLAEIAESLELGKYLFLSRGEEKSGGRHKSYILANTVEALIGAVYVDHDYETARKLINRFILKKLDEIIENDLHVDAKSRFQELCQEKEQYTPYYEVIDEQGPDHDKKFTMGAYIAGRKIAEGIGSSKQKAENDAAKKALKKLGWT